MTAAELIPTLQSHALAREIERQIKNETATVIAAAERDAGAIIAQARATARRRMREAIEQLRREGASRLAGARAQLETELRTRSQRQAAQAVNDGLRILPAELDERWRDRQSRRQWMHAVAQQCILRLRPGSWLIEHPADWIEPEQRDFVAAVGGRDGIDINFKAVGDFKSGLRVKADQAVLDATPQGLLADDRSVAALVLDEIGQE